MQHSLKDSLSTTTNCLVDNHHGQSADKISIMDISNSSINVLSPKAEANLKSLMLSPTSSKEQYEDQDNKEEEQTAEEDQDPQIAAAEDSVSLTSSGSSDDDLVFKSDYGVPDPTLAAYTSSSRHLETIYSQDPLDGKFDSDSSDSDRSIDLLTKSSRGRGSVVVKVDTDKPNLKDQLAVHDFDPVQDESGSGSGRGRSNSGDDRSTSSGKSNVSGKSKKSGSNDGSGSTDRSHGTKKSGGSFRVKQNSSFKLNGSFTRRATMDGSFRSERGIGMGESFRAERRATEPLDGSDHGSVASARELLGSALRNSFRRSRNDDTMSECGTTATDPTDPLNFRKSYRLTKQTSASDLRKSFTETKTIQSFRKLASNISDLVHHNNPNWKKVQELEKRRRAILKKTDSSFFRMLLFWDGTVLQALITEPMLWITMIIYILVRVGARIGLPTFVSEVGGTDTTTIGAFLTFFLVFHAHDAVVSFSTLYQASMDCEERIYDIATIAAAYLPRERAMRLVRYMNAAHIAGYVGLSEVYEYENFFKPINERKCVLTTEELERIEHVDMDKGNGGAAYKELLIWCTNEVADASRNKLISELVAQDLRNEILKFRSHFGTMYAFDDQPAPFFLTHFSVLMSFIFLPMIAVSDGLDAGTGDNVYWVKDVVQGVIIFLTALVLLGLWSLGNMLGDPYGDDLLDLSVLHYINVTWTHSNRMLHAQQTLPFHDQEERILRNSDELGEAWDMDIQKRKICDV